MKRKILTLVFSLLSLGLLAASFYGWTPYPGFQPPSIVEALGFITGALCVWLTVEENIWNWPIGIVNCAFYVVVFLRGRLFADMSLQVIYIALGFLGWYWWLHGGENRKALTVARTPRSVALCVSFVGILSTLALHAYLVSVRDAAPFLDALTTVMSLCAQFLLTKKYFENWFVWISVDVIYIYLYTTRGFYLTAFLYGLFIALCCAGLRQWMVAMRKAELELVIA